MEARASADAVAARTRRTRKGGERRRDPATGGVAEAVEARVPAAATLLGVPAAAGVPVG